MKSAKAAGFIQILCLALAACATDGRTQIETRVVEVPTPVPCKINLGSEPAYPDTDAAIHAAPNVAERARLYAAGRKMRIARQAEEDAALAKCSAVPK